jgi:PAS domain S-box-containing protein
MLGCTLLLPAKMIIPTLTTVAFPVLVIYPSATMLLGSLMNRRLLNWKTRESLAESEQRWKFALEGAGDGVWDWNVEKGEIYYSPKWKSMLGYEDRDIPNDLKVWDELLFPDDLAPANAEIEKHLKGETPVYTHIHRLRCKDGTYRWILDRGKVMQRDEQGRALRFIGTHTDISGRIESEKELKAAKEKAEESDRLKLSFLNNISHEVRTPLNAIMGFSEILDDEQDPESRKKYIRTIRSNSEQLLGIITDVLDFSRLESEDIRIETQKFSLRDIFYDLFETMKPAALKAGLAFTVSPESSTIDSEFLGDRNKIRQVMISLISNAIKYTSEGSVEIGWKTGAGGVRFFVRDTGIGIDSELKSKVFERFYRAPSAQKLAVRGAGLGLSISKQLVDMMGGTIGTMPNEPRGSVFFMVLPLLPWIPLPVEEENTDSLKSLSDLHILIAEDEDANYELLQVLLRRQCRVVERAFNGEDVIEKVQRTRPDLILMDIKMPVLDGLEATRRIRSNNFQGPIIAVTAYSQPEEKKLAEEAGCNHFLSKPINKSKLLDLLENAIRQ